MRSLKDFIEGDRNEGFHAEFYEELQKKDEELGFMRSIEQSEKGKGDLSGVPFVVKDAICTEGTVTSAGSNIIENYEPVFDATVVERLKEAGATFYGKTNQDEFGFGTFSTNCAFETPKNPHDPERVVLLVAQEQSLQQWTNLLSQSENPLEDLLQTLLHTME